MATSRRRSSYPYEEYVVTSTPRGDRGRYPIVTTYESKPAAPHRGGLADDYHAGRPDKNDNHGLPRRTRRASLVGVDDGDSPRTRARRAFEALDAGDGVSQALEAIRPRSHSMAPRRHHGHHYEDAAADDDDDDEDDNHYVLDVPRHERRDHHPHHRHHHRRDDHDHDYYDDRDDHDDRRRDRHRDNRRDHRHHDEPQPSSAKRSSSANQMQQVARTAAVAGLIEYIRKRKDPGPWNGPKAKSVATAALSAAVIDAGLAKHDKDHPDKHAARNAIMSTVGGMMVNKFANRKG